MVQRDETTSHGTTQLPCLAWCQVCLSFVVFVYFENEWVMLGCRLDAYLVMEWLAVTLLVSRPPPRTLFLPTPARRPRPGSHRVRWGPLAAAPLAVFRDPGNYALAPLPAVRLCSRVGFFPGLAALLNRRPDAGGFEFRGSGRPTPLRRRAAARASVELAVACDSIDMLRECVELHMRSAGNYLLNTCCQRVGGRGGVLGTVWRL